MKFKLELTINKPRPEVWKTFDDPSNMGKWQLSLKKIEPLNGVPGQPGAVSKLTFEENGREFSLIEKVTHREEPERLEGMYENEFSTNSVDNTFIEQDGNSTLWAVETEFRFKTFPMKIAGPLMKNNFVRRTHRDMERFKELVEGL